LFLAREASEISLLEIIEAIEGPIALNRCTAHPSQCEHTENCPVYPVWQQAQSRLVHLLETTTLGDLTDSA
jgi:DNA-binding IscR family transcriptional regulator